jgi:hypothetical protein
VVPACGSGGRWEICGLARGSGRSFLASVAFLVVLAASGRAAPAPLPPSAVTPIPADDDTSLPPPIPRHPLALTLGEEFAVLALQGVWYWGHSRYGSEGKDPTVENFFSSLISDDFVLEDDTFRTNGVGHPISGAFAYQVARGNGMTVAQSFLASFLSAVAWKYFGEWNQTHSTNDLIISPAAGWVIGEATYRVGRLFAAGEPGVFNCIGAAALSPFAALNGSSVCGFRRADHSPSGVSLPTWHRLAAEIGPSITTFDGKDARTGVVIGVGALIRANARYRSPGSGSSTAWPGQWSSVRARVLVENAAIQGTTFDADALVIGRYVRRYADTGGASGDPDGWGALLGLSSSFDYDGRDLPIGSDRTAAAGLLGPTIELSARRGPLELRAWLVATYAFSQVTSLAYAQAAASFGGADLKAVLQRRGYYYAQGPVSRAALEGRIGIVRLGVEGRMSNYWSIDSGYSNQSAIDDNFSLRDTRIFTRAIASVQPLGGPLRLALEWDQDLRESRIPGTVVRSNERRFLASLALVSR